MNLRMLVFFAIVVFTTISCSAPKELIERYDYSDTINEIYKPNVFTIFPSLNFHQWLIDNRRFHLDIPKEVERNQLGMTFTDREKGTQTYFIMPSARPRAMLDTLTKISNIEMLKGSWQIKYSQTILYKDSVSLIDSTIYRTATVLETNKKDAVILDINESNVKMFVKSNPSGNFKKIFSRSYNLLNGRYMLIYNALHTTSATNFVGINNQNELIWDTYKVVDEFKPTKYKTYSTLAMRFVYRKMK